MSKTYKEWIKSCPQLILPECGAIDFPVSVSYTFFLPDKRLRDLTNYIKAPEDYLVSQCVLFDDNHKIVQRAVLELGGLDKGCPRVQIVIYQIKPPV
jgi:Holliday junction resolvase RusA-like endonuclease